MNFEFNESYFHIIIKVEIVPSFIRIIWQCDFIVNMRFLITYTFMVCGKYNTHVARDMPFTNFLSKKAIKEKTGLQTHLEKVLRCKIFSRKFYNHL